MNETKADPRLGRARELYAQGDPASAVDTLMMLLAGNPFQAEALDLLYHMGAGPAGALCREGVERLVAQHPGAVAFHAVAAGLYLTLAKPREEIAHLDVLKKSGVRTEPFYLQYATALRNAARTQEAFAVCNKALAAYPRAVKLLKLRGGMYVAQGEFEAALRDFSQCLRLDGSDHHARLKRGATLLLMSDCRDGFEEFSAHRDMELEKYAFAFTAPEWRGEPLAGKRLLVWASQGVGDVCMFAGFLPWVAAQGAQVTLALYPKLMPLFARAFPWARVVMLTTDLPARHGGACDYQVTIGQLMAQALPQYMPAEHPPYLTPDAARAGALRARYRALSGGARDRLIGISWHTTNTDTGMHRNIPLKQWEPLFSLPGVQFVSLQYGDHAQEIAAVGSRFPGALHSDAGVDGYNDMDALAAQIMAVDEVMTIDNSTVHLAGALGAPTTLLLSTLPDWRWGIGHESCRWYGSVRILRQEKPFDWQPAIGRLRGSLAA